MKVRLIGVTVVLGMILLVLLTGCGNLSPIASFTCTPSSGESPLTVSFNASASHDSDGTIVSYQWAFGDGNSGADVTASHTYTATSNRTYSVTLTVTDDGGSQATESHVVSVTSPPPALLEILDWQLTNDGNSIWPWVVVGHAQNVSGHALGYAGVRANFYDGSGVMLNNWIDNVLDLPAGVTWEFNIRCIDSDVSGRVDHATVSVGTCY